MHSLKTDVDRAVNVVLDVGMESKVGMTDAECRTAFARRQFAQANGDNASAQYRWTPSLAWCNAAKARSIVNNHLNL